MKRRFEIKGKAENSDQMNINKESYDKISLQLLSLARQAIQKHKLIAVIVLTTMLFTSGITLLVSNRFISKASILPYGKIDRLSELKTLAGIGGLNADDNSTELFPVVLRSQLIKDAVLKKEYRFLDGSEEKSITLKDYFNINDSDILYGKLDDMLAVSIDTKTRVVNVAVESRYPGLSQAVLTEFLDQLEYYNLYKRRSRAKENAIYLGRQLVDRKKELRKIEDSLQAFQNVNRNWASTSDPTILMNMNRLQRDIEVNSQAYLYLTQEYEIAKLNEQKDIPIVRLLDKPSLPTVKSGPYRMKIVLFSGVFSFFVILLVILINDVIKYRFGKPEKEIMATCREEFSKEFPRTNRLLSRHKTGVSI